MKLHTVALESARLQPWRNGGGSTREYLAWPVADPWALRVSVADIEGDGPFSSFPGVDRWFSVLAGSGVSLRFDGGETWRVTRDKAMLQFDGERAPHCTLIDGATRDLNVMAMRDGGNAVCELVENGTARAAQTSLRAIFAGDATRLLREEEPDIDLPPMTLAWSENDEGRIWRAVTQGRAWWIEFTIRNPL